MECIRIRHFVQVEYVLLALFINDRLTIFEAVGTESYSHLGAKLTATGASYARSLLHVGAISTQVELLSDDIAELENVASDLIRADIIFLKP